MKKNLSIRLMVSAVPLLFTFLTLMAAAQTLNDAEQKKDDEFQSLKNAGMSKREYLESIDDYLEKGLPNELKKLQEKMGGLQKQLDSLQASMDELKAVKKSANDPVLMSDPQWEKLKTFDPATFETLRKDFDALVNDRISAIELKTLSLSQGVKALETVLNNVSGMQVMGGGSTPTFAPIAPIGGTATGGPKPQIGSGSGNGP